MIHSIWYLLRPRRCLIRLINVLCHSRTEQVCFGFFAFFDFLDVLPIHPSCTQPASGAQPSSRLVKLPVGILNAQDFKTCGHTFRQYLDRHPYWAALVKASPGLSPYSLRHGYAYRGALAGIPLRQLAASMGHDVRTHMKHYGQWTDEAGLDAAFGAANAKLTASLTKR